MEALRPDCNDFEAILITFVEYGHKVASIGWRIQRTITYDDATTLAYTFPALLEEAETAENVVLDWIHNREHTLTSPARVQQHIYAWNMYRCTRCKLLHLFIKLLDHVERLSPTWADPVLLNDRRRKYVLVIRCTFDEILDTVRPALEETDSKPIDQALMTSRPLH